MSYAEEIKLQCDECARYTRVETETVTDAREYAAGRGWVTNTGGPDICPVCDGP